MYLLYYIDSLITMILAPAINLDKVTGITL